MFILATAHYEGEIPVLYNEENPNDFRSCGYPVVASGPMASAHVTAPERLRVTMWTVCEDGNRRPGAV